MIATIKDARLNILDGGRTNIDIDIALPTGAEQTIQIYDTVENLKIRFDFEMPESIIGRTCEVEEDQKWVFVKYLN